MKKAFLLLLLSTFFFCETGIPAKKPQPVTMNDTILIQEFQHALDTNLLNTWFPRIIDRKNGGYYNRFDYQWKLKSAGPKIIVPQARGMWVACKAALRYPEEKKFTDAAEHGFQFLKESGWDQKFEGFYHFFPQKGSQIPDKTYKTSYGNVFAIFALSTYHQLTQSKEALELAKKTFYWLETHAYDQVYGGYFDWITREGISYKDKENFSMSLFPSEHGIFIKKKDFNSTIHIMEAFSELYKIWPDSLLRQRLLEIYEIVQNKMVQKQGYMKLHFEEDWTHYSLQDSSETFFRNNSWLDHVSFGHDMETAYLLYETAHTLKIEPDLEKLKTMMDHSIQNGFDKNFQGIFYEAYYFDNQDSIQIINEMKDWWVQAEGLNSLLLFSILYPENKKYKEVFCHLWDYTKKYIIDYEYGGWYPHGIDQHTQKYKKEDKAYQWKSCYHNYRALSNCLDMLKTGKIKL